MMHKEETKSFEALKALVEAQVIDYVTSNLEHFFPSLNRNRRNSKPRPNYWESVWGKMLLDPTTEDPNSTTAKKFRRRFRVPYPLFQEVIVPQCDEKKVFKATTQGKIPTAFKVLIALRVLGRDAIGDECEELSLMGESTCHFIFKEFVTNYSKHFYDVYTQSKMFAY